MLTNTPTLVEWYCVASEHSRSAGYKDRREWVGTTVKFDIERLGDNQTRLNFRHAGLVELMECYGSCSNIGGFYLQSVKKLAEFGKGDPFAGGGREQRAKPWWRIWSPAACAPTASLWRRRHREIQRRDRRDEPDTLMYRSYRDAKDPLSFVHYMLFKDAAAHAKHRGSAYCADFVKTLYPCREQKPEPVNLELFREAADA